eukprot:1409047-Rhodomonas_salina.1
MVLMTTGVVVFGTLLSEVQSGVAEMRKFSREKGQMIQKLKNYMRMEGVSAAMERRILGWVSFPLSSSLSRSRSRSRSVSLALALVLSRPLSLSLAPSSPSLAPSSPLPPASLLHPSSSSSSAPSSLPSSLHPSLPPLPPSPGAQQEEHTQQKQRWEQRGGRGERASTEGAGDI